MRVIRAAPIFLSAFLVGVLPRLAYSKITQPTQTYKNKVRLPIQFDAFIPAPTLLNPLNPFTYFGGDNRTFGTNPNQYRVAQKATLIPVTSVEPLGFDVASVANLAGLSTEWASSSVDASGNIIAGSAPILTGTASTAGMSVAVTRTGDRAVQAEMSGSVANPLISIACNISWDLFVLVDGASKASPVYSITGTTGHFPAYEMYIGSQNVPVFDPGGNISLTLCLRQSAITPISGGIR